MTSEEFDICVEPYRTRKPQAKGDPEAYVMWQMFANDLMKYAGNVNENELVAPFTAMCRTSCGTHLHPQHTTCMYTRTHTSTKFNPGYLQFFSRTAVNIKQKVAQATDGRPFGN